MLVASLRCSTRLYALLLLLAGIAALALAGCDAAGPTAEEAPEPHAGAPAGNADTSAGGLRMTPIPEGARLLPASGGAPPEDDEDRAPGAATNAPGHGAPGKGASRDASPYGCLLSTLDPDGEPYAYRYNQVYLHFPKGVVKQAEGESQRVALVFGSKTLYAEDQPRAEAVVGRLLRCRIPKSKAALKLLQNEIRRFRQRQSDEKGTNEKAALASEVTDALVSKAQKNASGEAALSSSNAAPSSPRPGGGATTQDWYCAEWTYAYVGTHTGMRLDDVFCSRHGFTYDSIGDPGGRGGGGGGGSDNGSDRGRGGGGSDSPDGGNDGGPDAERCPETTTDDGLIKEVCPPEKGETPWGKAVKIGRKVVDAAKRGEDLLDIKTWKKIGKEEWTDLADCGLSALSATSGDTVALLEVLNCAADQLLGANFLDMLKGLEAADRLGFSWYDDATDYIGLSKHFDKFARAAPDFVLDNPKLLNSIDDLTTLTEVGKARRLKFDYKGRPIYKMYNGTAQTVMDNFARKWGLPTGLERLDYGNTVMTMHKGSGGSDRWTIQLKRGGDISKFRFEKWK